MFTLREIPKDLKNHKQRIVFLKKTINKHYKLITAKQNALTKLKWEMGCRLRVLGYMLEQMKIDYDDFIEENFPHIHLQTIYRALELGTIDMDMYPHLTVAGETRLIELLILSEETNFDNFLLQNRIISKFNSKNLSRVRSFREQIDSIIENAHKSTKLKSQKMGQVLRKITRIIKSFVEEIEALKKEESAVRNLTINDFVKPIREVEDLLNNLKAIKYRIGSKNIHKRRKRYDPNEYDPKRYDPNEYD